jgi:DNA modification methylase
MLIQGDARDLPLADQSVQCVVTSPPYWGLRDYGLPPSVWDADPACAHGWGEEAVRVSGGDRDRGLAFTGTGAPDTRRPGLEARHQTLTSGGVFCTRCPAWRGVLGLEPTPDLYVAHLVQCFREVRRVLRPDGTVWLNLGDSYAATTKGSGGHNPKQDSNVGSWFSDRSWSIPPGLKPKDLVGIPWRVAFALQQDGWYLRADVIWAKPNPMPESVTDRPTKAHEYLFLLAKGERYFYDGEAVKEPHTRDPYGGNDGYAPSVKDHHLSSQSAIREGTGRFGNPASGRNRRSVWLIATEPYPEAHFATFPEALVAPCILAGTSEAGACRACGAPWERVVDSIGIVRRMGPKTDLKIAMGLRTQFGGALTHKSPIVTTTGWRPTCACAAPARPCLVLDPFAGTATVGAVAERLGRAWVAVDLKPEYLALARKRTAQRGLRFTDWRPAVTMNGHGHGRMRL